MRVAINVGDVARHNGPVTQILLAGKLDALPIQAEKALDGGAAVFTCDDLTAACCCDTIRTRDRNRRQYPTRVYIRGARGGWRRVGSHAPLAIVVNEVPQLNPAVFK